MICRDMRKAKNTVRSSKDYNRYHDQEEIAAYENTPTEMEECIDNEDDEMQQAPPNDYNKIPLGVDAPPETVDFSRKEAMKIDCNTALPDERATIQEGIPLEKIPQTEKETVPEAASIKLDVPSDTAEVEATSLIESPPSGIDSKGSNIQIGDNPPNSLLPNMSPDNPMASIPHYSKPNKAVRAKISLSHGEVQKRLGEIQKSLPGLNLLAISDLVCENLRLIKHNGGIYYYDGRSHKPLTPDRFKKAATDCLPPSLLKKLATMQIFEQAYEFLRIRMLDELDEECEDEWISFENGDYNATTGDFEPHDPKHLTFFVIHARFDPSQMFCPYMDGTLAFMTDDDEVSIALVWSMLGYLMLDTPPQRAFFYIGPAPASGKSLLGNIIDLLFGEGSCYHAEVDALGQKFGLAGFYNSNICLAMESPGKLKKETVLRIKELTGNATISIERKGIDREEIKNRTRLVMASNDALQVEDDAFWDRCKIIPAIQSCPEEQRDPKLDVKIWAERDAIATRAAYAAHDLINRRFQFIESERALAIKRAWRHEARSSLDSFVADCLEFTSDRNFVSTDQMYNLYISSGYEEMSKTAFSMKLSPKLCGRAEKTTIQRPRGYFGLHIKCPADESYHSEA